MATMSEVCSRMPEHERDDVVALAREVLFMRDKLAETRRELASQGVTVEYDNGGGQTGVRRNPAFDAYEALLRTYLSALGELRAIVDAAGASGAARPRVVSVAGNSKWAKKASGG